MVERPLFEIVADVPPSVAEIIARHAPTAARMNDFCRRLFDGDLHAEYPESEAYSRSLQIGHEEAAATQSPRPSRLTAVEMQRSVPFDHIARP